MNNFNFMRLDNGLRAYEKVFKHKFLLVNKNLNDYGYYTRFCLYLCQKQKENYPLANLMIFDADQQRGDTFSTLENAITYFADIDSSIKFTLFFSPEDRQSFLSTFNVAFDALTSEIFNLSILRGITLDSWEILQTQIKNLVTSPLDFSYWHNQFIQSIDCINVNSVSKQELNHKLPKIIENEITIQ